MAAASQRCTAGEGDCWVSLPVSHSGDLEHGVVASPTIVPAVACSLSAVVSKKNQARRDRAERAQPESLVQVNEYNRASGR
jgi:hypothetical protein